MHSPTGLVPTGLVRVVADYIAGMTDSFILHQYAQIKRAIRF